jgi:hypothetical protein
MTSLLQPRDRAMASCHQDRRSVKRQLVHQWGMRFDPSALSFPQYQGHQTAGYEASFNRSYILPYHWRHLASSDFIVSSNCLHPSPIASLILCLCMTLKRLSSNFTLYFFYSSFSIVFLCFPSVVDIMTPASFYLVLMTILTVYFKDVILTVYLTVSSFRVRSEDWDIRLMCLLSRHRILTVGTDVIINQMLT